MTARPRLERVRERATRSKTRTLRIAFGDDVGVLLFLLATLFSLSTWRIGVFITDNLTLANAFVAVADGQLHVETIRYGPEHGRTPGMNVIDGRRYGLNYGQLFLSLPVLWLLWGVSTVMDPAVALVVTFGLLVLALFVHLGRMFDREVALSYVGVVLAAAATAANLAVAVELRPYWIPFAAMQLAAILAASLSVVVLYRLLRRIHGPGIGFVGGSIAALASPIPFWATIPKRHAFTALLVLASLYYFYRSRETPSDVRWHALAYVPVGLLAWIMPGEGFVLLGTLVVSDVLTVPRVGLRRFVAVSVAFLASLVPFLLTNWLVSGEVLTPPRMALFYVANWDAVLAVRAGDFAPASDGLAMATTVPGQPGAGPVLASSGSESVLDALRPWLVDVARTAVDRVELFLEFARKSRAVASDRGRLYRIFVRRGYVHAVYEQAAEGAVSLSLLESMPVLGGLVAVPIAFLRGVWSRISGRTTWGVRRNPTVAADLFVGCFGVLLLSLYLPRLLVHVSWTVRYLHPLYPLGVYALLRNPAVRDPILSDASLLTAAYAVAVVAVGELLVLALGVGDLTLTEAVQLHALLAVGLGGLMAGWAVIYTAAGDRFPGRTRRRVRRLGAILLALCCAATTLFVVMWAVAYFPHSQFAVPAVGEVARMLPSPT